MLSGQTVLPFLVKRAGGDIRRDKDDVKDAVKDVKQNINMEKSKFISKNRKSKSNEKAKGTIML